MRIWLLLFFIPGIAAANIEVNGRVFYKKAADPSKPAYLFRSYTKEEGSKRHIETLYTDLNGTVLSTETADFENGELLSTTYRQNQMKDEYGDAKREGDKLVYTFLKEGKTKQESEKYNPSMMVSPMVVDFVLKNWDRLMNGETLPVRLVLIERTETIGFKFFKGGEEKLRGQDVVEIVMKPSSFLIGMMVIPIRLYFTKAAPHWLMESKGRTPIRVAIKNPPTQRKDWEAIDARVEYDAPKIEPVAAPAPKAKKSKKRAK